MITLTIDDITYSFSGHALDRMLRQHITPGMVEAVMLDPDRNELSVSSSYFVYDKQLSGRRSLLRVVVDEDDRKIVSVHWLGL